MKYCLLVFLMLLSISFVHAQCEPEDGLPLDKVGLYPLPFGVIPVEEGGTGISDTAFIGELFDYRFTIVFPDTFLDPSTNSLTRGDTLQVIPDSTRFMFEDEIVGFPEGLSLEVIPDGPMLGTREAPTGCMRLHGTPTENVVPGDYLVFFGARSCIDNPTFTGCTFVLFPSIFTGIVGEYRLTIADKTSPTLDVLNSKQDLSVVPNPLTSRAQLSFDTDGMSGSYQLRIVDLSGRLIQSEMIPIQSGRQVKELDASDWESGMYIFQLSGPEGQMTGRLMVH